MIFDEPVVIQCYTSLDRIAENAGQLRSFLTRLGHETRQGAVGFAIDREYFEITFPLPKE